MKNASDIKPVSYLKSHLADMLTQINETHRPIFITQNGEARAVLQDAKSYDRIRTTLGLLKLIAQGEEDVKQGRTKTQKDVFADLSKSLTETHGS